MTARRADAPGMIDPANDLAAARLDGFLHQEPVVWLSTVRPDGTPHLVPTWFWWDGTALVVFSKPDAVKARNLRANPRLMVAVGDPEDDFSVGLIEAEATCVDDAPIPDAFFAKYTAELGPGRLDPATFRAMYTQSIRIVPTRFLAWHGRGESPAPVAVVPQPTVAATLAVRIAARLESLSARLRGPGTSAVATPA